MQRNRPNKVFRIEKTMRENINATLKKGSMNIASSDSENDEKIDELLEEVRNLRGDISRLVGGELEELEKAPSKEVIEDYKNQIIEASNLRKDLQELSDAIEATKVEIASLRADTVQDDKIHVASLELSAVVSDTEKATDRIIESAETIESLTDRLRSEIKEGQLVEVLDEIAERVVAVFEACNFQDITGQRITKVVNTMNFIDERIHGMMEIWGGKELFAGLGNVEEDTVPEGDKLHGPALPGASISQDEIDALFD